MILRLKTPELSSERNQVPASFADPRLVSQLSPMKAFETVGV